MNPNEAPHGIYADAVPTLDSTSPATRSAPGAWLAALRPKQWAKNVLVFAAPGAAGVLNHADVFVDVFVAFVAFCMAASGTYLINDASDVDADRLHPTKRFRPIAAGQISVASGRVVGVLLLAGGLAVSFAARWELAVVLVVYVACTTAYTLWFKHVVLFDVAFVAAGFVLRTIAGASASNVPISDWFFIVATFGSLFIVVGKRQSELHTMGAGDATTRPILAAYTDSYLNYLRSVSTGVILVAYCLWAFEKAAVASVGVDNPVPWFQLSAIPFALAILRYALIIDRGEAGAPEDVILSDRALIILGGLWAVLFGLGIYAT